MQFQKEQLDAATLAAFDFDNFDEHHRCDEVEWEAIFSNGHVPIYTARDENGIVAAIAVFKTSKHHKTRWYFYSIAVAENYRRQGLAKDLFYHVLGAEPILGKLNSHCHIDNEASIALHRALGFNIIQYVPDFYGDFEDAFLWVHPT
jgi:ribosomal protein S18 acetylase RimI-like enzyme